jgi:hypothetical protein
MCDFDINNFIIKVFNYYNGRINPVNKAVLDINTANQMNSSEGGHSGLPNLVTIHPSVISRFYSTTEEIKMSIISTIIHELYHTDQLINYQLYKADINYNRTIEHACELETIIYIAGHANEINNLFGLNISIDKNMYEKCINYYYMPGLRYQRRYYHDHIFMCIDNICGLDKSTGETLYSDIVNAINTHKDIIIKINNDIIRVSYNNTLISIEDFNNIMIKYRCTGLYKCNMQIDYDNGNVYMTINAELKNIMCKKAY